MSGCGPPLYEPDLSAGGALTRPVQDLCELWRSSDVPDLQTVSAFDLSAWSTFQIVLFLDRMLDLAALPHGTLQNYSITDPTHSTADSTDTNTCVSPDVMAGLSSSYASLFDGLNAEVQIRWLQLVVRNSFYPELPRVRAFLHKHVSNMKVQCDVTA